MIRIRPHLCSPVLSPKHPPVPLLDRPDGSSMRLTELHRSQRRLRRAQLCCILQAAELALQQQALPLLLLQLLLRNTNVRVQQTG